ncbi:hypothetical protein O988_07347 [Pseudogymnoascus sp. VKM F-3808]|nr:hypothetical protein O988_07347 [Pseudogymnoascus sp. VKM F-3808]
MPPKTETPSFHPFCSPRYSDDSGVYETKTRSSLGKWPRVADPPAWHPWLEHSTLDASNSTTAPSITMPIFPWRRGSATEASYSRVPDDMTMADRLSDEEAAHPASGAGTRISTGSLQRPRPHTEDTTASSSDLSAPRFLQQDGTYRKYPWLPTRVERYSKATVRWLKGPEPPRRHHIKPWFPKVQEAPIRFLDTYVPKYRARLALLLFFYLCWGLTFGLILRYSNSVADIGSYGQPVSIDCGATFWSSGNSCGLQGTDCRPFEGQSLAFRCPASCAGFKVLNPRAVGTQEINYASLVIGGPHDDNIGDPRATYRGDSFLCQAAIHAGVINDKEGGCGVVSKNGAASSFTSSNRNGIKSIGFDSHFPLSFVFQPDITCSAKDMRWSLLAVSVIYTSILSIFVTSPSVFFFTIFTTVFIHVGLVSDPPTHSSILDLLQTLVSRFLPAMFVAFVFYTFAIRRTLRGLTAQVDKTILWLGGCWVGSLTNYTFDFIPIQRLTPHDLNQQPGAKAALAFIVIILLAIVAQQVWSFRTEGRLLRYLGFYAILLVGIIVCICIPGLNLRIHHYILAILLIPGTSMQTRPSLLFQGILLGLFINGIARWGFDSLLQTDASLLDDAQHNSLLPSPFPPVIKLATTSTSNSNITFTWPDLESDFDGVSILVNDVERFRGFVDDEPRNGRGFMWERKPDLDLNEYFRFAFMQGTSTLDYTKAGTWTKEGKWVEMAPGPSRRVKREEVGGGVVGDSEITIVQSIYGSQFVPPIARLGSMTYRIISKPTINASPSTSKLPQRLTPLPPPHHHNPSTPKSNSHRARTPHAHSTETQPRRSHRRLPAASRLPSPRHSSPPTIQPTLARRRRARALTAAAPGAFRLAAPRGPVVLGSPKKELKEGSRMDRSTEDGTRADAGTGRALEKEVTRKNARLIDKLVLYCTSYMPSPILQLGIIAPGFTTWNVAFRH